MSRSRQNRPADRWSVQRKAGRTLIVLLRRLDDTGDSRRRPSEPKCARAAEASTDVWGFRRYQILGACNPALAYEALNLEDKVGTMLPCNVIVQEVGPDQTEVAAIDPVASMRAIDNPKLHEAASVVRAKLQRVVDSL